ncbi:agmatinase family protein [Brevibacillus humidisoli]|uniref:agmatinase family protein n=1 Tax=Brevibacillus humidisoli TaxID=2895522 RepID=UPI001E2C7CD5|nr:agmatinase family protein [Brevibacillus humidisoli]UFJ42490.1 agmatinase family protein [Brevibacillus humidisoli]
MSEFSYLTAPPVRFAPGKGDPYVTRLSDWIQTDGLSEGDPELLLIGVPLSKSSISFSGAHSHPQQFRQLWTSFTTYNMDEDIDLAGLTAVDLGDIKMHITDIPQCHYNIEEALHEVTSRYAGLPVLVGGDHSITYPAIRGINRSRQQRVGLIQFDAHLDVRDTQYGGRSNGTPIRSLIETNTIRAEDIVSIGLRSFANSKEYRQYAEQQGMTLFTAKHVQQTGIKQVLEWAVNFLESKCDVIYATFDIDVMDQSLVPGVPAIGPAGLSAEDVFYSAYQLGCLRNVIGMDMVCVDPTKDVRDATSRVALHVFLHFASGYYRRLRG